ncbi:MAG: PLP-dependent aminotransferase family protein [bacterium]
MSVHLDHLLSDNAKALKKSAIRELLKLTAKPEIISFAGGLPNPKTFPIEDVKRISDEVLESQGEKILQYSTTEGDHEFREVLCGWLGEEGIMVKPENVQITTASQQGLDLVSRVFLNPGDTCIVGLPTYLGFLQATNSVRAKPVGIPLDDQGIKTDIIEDEIDRLISEQKKPKFIYVIPDFQNPAGVTISLDRRKKLIEIAKKYEILIVEDSPYRKLRYSGKTLPTIYSLDDSGEHVITLFTFSKIFLPGFRLGWMIGSKDIIEKIVMAKQGMDLCTPIFNQTIAKEYIKQDLIKARIEKNIDMYSKRKDIMLESLEKYMPKIEGLTWTKPEGGLFLWVTLPEAMNADRMFYNAIEQNVAYVVGSAFFCNGKGQNTMRLNFSYPSEEQIRTGIQRLANVVENDWKKIEQGNMNNTPLTP